MNNVFFAQYDKTTYPLKKFTVNEIPDRMTDIFRSDEKSLIGVFRGGFAYALLTKDADYVLSDIDLIYPLGVFDSVVEFYARLADKVFVNHNTFHNTVVTAFWQSGDNYYKTDSLILEKLPPTIPIEWKNHTLRTVDGFFLWRDRLLKISQRKLRGHTEQKTRNHLSVAKNLAEYLLEAEMPVATNLPCNLEQLVSATINVAAELLTPSEATAFTDAQKRLLLKTEA